MATTTAIYKNKTIIKTSRGYVVNYEFYQTLAAATAAIDAGVVN